jgi:hypothetical protein
MAKYRFRGPLNQADIPLLTFLSADSVVSSQLDIAGKVNQGFAGSSDSHTYNIPHIMFCENVMPSADGIISCEYEEVIPPIVPPVGASPVTVRQVIPIRFSDESIILFADAVTNATGETSPYIYVPGMTAWIRLEFVFTANYTVTRAYVIGRTFLCFAFDTGDYQVREFVYAAGETIPRFNGVSLLGLQDTNIKGIGASSGYMIAYSDLDVYWSSLDNPLDFVPDAGSAAGSSAPIDLKSGITAILTTSGGFLISSDRNLVFATYTQNALIPFIFREIANAGGISSYEQATSDQTSGIVYTWGTGGLQKVSQQKAETLSGNLNDFLAGGIIESWNPATNQITSIMDDGLEFKVKVTYVSSRYLVISYAPSRALGYQYALVFDTVLQRWGKLKIDHADCFEYPYPDTRADLEYRDLVNAYSTYTQSYADLDTVRVLVQPSKKAIGFVKENGSIQLALFEYNKTINSNAVIVFGKMQLTRARLAAIQQLTLSGKFYLNDLRVKALSGELTDGNSFSKDMIPASSNSNVMQLWRTRLIGLSLSIAVTGTFALSSYLLEVTNEGDR